MALDEDVANYLVNFSGVSAGGSGESQVLTARAVSSNPSVIPNPTVTYSSPVSGGYLQFSPVRNAFGSAVISVTIDDGQPTNNLVTRSFTVVVRPVNDSPTLDAITSVTVQEDAPEQVVNFTGASFPGGV